MDNYIQMNRALHPDTEEPPGRAAIPITSCTTDEAPRVAIERFLRVAESMLDVADIRLRCLAGGSRPVAGYLLVTEANLDRAMANAQTIRTIARATMPFFQLAEPTAEFEGSAPGSVVSLIVSGRDERDTPSVDVLPWVAAAECADRVSLDVDILALRTNLDQPQVEMRVEIRGSSRDTAMIAALIAVSVSGETRVVPSFERVASIAVPLSLGARILLAPFHEIGAWNRRPTSEARQIDQIFDGAARTTSLVLGGDHQDRWNLQLHQARAAVEAGRTVAVITTELRAAAVCASLLASGGHAFDSVVVDDDGSTSINLCDLGEENRRARMSDLVELISSTSSDEPMSPSIRRALRCTLGVLTLDEVGPGPLTLLETLWTAGPLPRPLLETLKQLRDPDALRDLEAVRSAIEEDPSLRQHLLSRAEFWLGDLRVRQVVGSAGTQPHFHRYLRDRSLVVAVPAATLGDRGSSLIASFVTMRLLHEVTRPGHDGAVEFLVDLDGLPQFVVRRLLDYASRDRGHVMLASRSPQSLDVAVLADVCAQVGMVASSRLSIMDAALIDGHYPTIPMSRAQRLDRGEWAITVGTRDWIARVDTLSADADIALLRISGLLSTQPSSTWRWSD